MGLDRWTLLDRALSERRWADETGQALTEYLMMLGLLTAIIISLTIAIVPGLAYVVVRLVRFMAVFMTGAPN